MKAPVKPAGLLYVLATPIGCLEDLTFRAQRLLQEVDVIFAEDTRHSLNLLRHLGIEKTLISLHEHNEQQRRYKLLAYLEEGKRVALLSDAGSPGISDPGAQAVAMAHENGFEVCPVVGPSALVAALSVSGFMLSEGLFFSGFLANRGALRQQQIEQLLSKEGVVICFESPHRIVSLVKALATAQPQRQSCLCREMTKQFEEIVRQPLEDLWKHLQSKPPRGEYTLVLGPYADLKMSSLGIPAQDVPWLRAEGAEQKIHQALQRCLQAGLSCKDTAALLHDLTDLPKKQLYQLAIASKP